MCGMDLICCDLMVGNCLFVDPCALICFNEKYNELGVIYCSYWVWVSFIEQSGFNCYWVGCHLLNKLDLIVIGLGVIY